MENKIAPVRENAGMRNRGQNMGALTGEVLELLVRQFPDWDDVVRVMLVEVVQTLDKPLLQLDFNLFKDLVILVGWLTGSLIVYEN